jgi:DNA-binding SARP family transcriptional activator
VTPTASDSALLTIRLFGALEATSRGVPLKRPVRRDTERLWQLLLVQRDQVRSREAVATLLWPEATAQKARFNLRYHLHQLLNHLPELPEPERWVDGDRDTIRWNPNAPMWLDIGAFDAFRKEGLAKADRSPAEADGLLDGATALYRADLLVDVPDDWAVGPRDQLREDVIGALDALIRIRERSGRIGPALTSARRLLEIDPHREVSYRHIMRLGGRSGDRTAALDAFSACTAMLDSEFGVEPSEETPKTSCRDPRRIRWRRRRLHRPPPRRARHCPGTRARRRPVPAIRCRSSSAASSVDGRRWARSRWRCSARAWSR